MLVISFSMFLPFLHFVEAPTINNSPTRGIPLRSKKRRKHCLDVFLERKITFHFIQCYFVFILANWRGTTFSLPEYGGFQTKWKRMKWFFCFVCSLNRNRNDEWNIHVYEKQQGILETEWKWNQFGIACVHEWTKYTHQL